MKYQTFNRSCSYASIANLLTSEGVDTEDYQIAIEMDLPYYFTFDQTYSKYSAGPMLQGKKWFDLYLNRYGYEINEVTINQEDLESFLSTSHKRFMLSMTFQSIGKHAVIYDGVKDGKYRILNNKWANSTEEEYLFLELDELKERIVFSTPFASLKKMSNQSELSNKSLLNESIMTLSKYLKDVKAFVDVEQSYENQVVARTELFESVFVDVFSMMKIIGENNIIEKLSLLRNEYIKTFNLRKRLILSDEIDIEAFYLVLDEIKRLISNRLVQTDIK